MFYRTKLKDFIRVPPELFNLPKDQAVLKRVKADFEGFISKDLGIVIDVEGVKEIEGGIVIPGDGAAYYNTEFEILTFKPELHEVILTKVKDIADFGAFMTLGPIEGMIHISQSMDDFVSFAKDKTLQGKETKRSLKVDDKCRGRIIAVSFKDITNPKLGLTMRQPYLGRFDWVEDDESSKKKSAVGEK